MTTTDGWNFEALLEGAGTSPDVRGRLAEFARRVLAANARFNLTGAESAGQIAGHVLDSLSVASYVGHPYADVGSGAGFPAVPLGIALSVPITVIESNAKKAQFLDSLFAPLALDGHVVHDRAERAAHRTDLRERFRAVTCRALGPIATVAELTVPLLALGGAAVLQRGAMEPTERASLQDAALILGARVEQEVRLEGARRIVILRKERQTPDRFPRRIGVPHKRPLCT
ncbi:MAG: 16S rRNA (guanine(527)-N(7))-methyltransferase RsmG [Candidatus Eremiobacteraeota bacterium]|nr:16S rRNA (guanine(527)-N(7))-methyltransferase RsmG [Candidatus Eremiobacteraeota bacterium]